MNKDTHKYFQNAYTSTPVQDNFNQLGFIPNGLTRLEFIALLIYTSPAADTTIEDSIFRAKKFIDEVENFKDEINKPTTLEIIK